MPDKLILSCACQDPEHVLTVTPHDAQHTVTLDLPDGAAVLLEETQVMELANFLKSQLAYWYFGGSSK